MSADDYSEQTPTRLVDELNRPGDEFLEDTRPGDSIEETRRLEGDDSLDELLIARRESSISGELPVQEVDCSEAAKKLDAAIRVRRAIKMHVPHKRISIDARAARRAVRWGRAEDERVVALDTVMKQRRQIERRLKSCATSTGLPATRAKAPALPPAAPRVPIIPLLIVLSLLIIGVMIVFALEF